MQDIVVVIPYNREFFLRGQKLIWSLNATGVSTSYMIYGVVTLLVLGGGLAVDYKGGFPLISLLGIVMLITILLKLRTLYLVRKSFFKRVKYLAHQYENNSPNGSYTFTDWGLEYADIERDTKYSWPLFEPVEIIKDNLILKLREQNEPFVILQCEQVGYETYETVKTIVLAKTVPKDEVLDH